MVLQGKGWGWSVLFTSLAWLIAVFCVAITIDLPGSEDRLFYELCAIWLFLSAVTVFAVDRYREGVARRRSGAGPVVETQREDEFLFMRMWVWPYVLLVFSVAAFVASLFH